MVRPIRKGLTLTEVLVVIAILAILICLFLPATRRVKDASARLQCMNNQKQIMLGIHTYYSMKENSVPSVQMLPAGCIGPGSIPENRLSWMVALLPFMEQDTLYRTIDLDKGYDGNQSAAQTHLRMFRCQSQEGPATEEPQATYIAMAGIGLDAASQPAGAKGNGFMGYDRQTSFEMIKDGTSNTLALMETRLNLGPWARGGSSTLRGFDPTDLPFYGDNRPFGGHPGGMIAAMADGSIRTIPASIDPAKLAAAITIDGGELTGLDW